MFTTGNFADWTGNMLDLGPLYPFVGYEGLMVILGFAFWIGWTLLQLTTEAKMYSRQAASLREGDALDRAVRNEHPPVRM